MIRFDKRNAMNYKKPLNSLFIENPGVFHFLSHTEFDFILGAGWAPSRKEINW